MVRQRGSTRWVLVVLVFAVVLFFLFPKTRNRPLSLVEAPFVWATGMVTDGLDGTGRWFSDLWSGYVDLRGTHEDNLRLRAENAELAAQVMAQQVAVEEAGRLQKLLELRQVQTQPTVAARVIGADATRWVRSLLLDRGSSDGISVGDGVITQAGVVGRVTMVTRGTAVVLVVSNRGSVIPARILHSRQAGILEGGTRLTGDLSDLPEEALLNRGGVVAQLKFMHRSAEVKVEDVIITSGLSGSFPQGLPIGKVIRVERGESDSFVRVYVLPQVRFDHLEEVLVLVGTVPTLASPEHKDKGR